MALEIDEEGTVAQKSSNCPGKDNWKTRCWMLCIRAFVSRLCRRRDKPKAKTLGSRGHVSYGQELSPLSGFPLTVVQFPRQRIVAQLAATRLT
jgi:hypothetical protein